MELFDLSGKVALVTGSTDGLGKAMAFGLGQAGATLIINGKLSKDKVDRVVDEFRARGIDAHGYLCDVTDEQEVNAMVADILEKTGAIDILVNNAGVNVRAPLAEMDAGQFRENIEVNLLGPFIVSKAVAGHMIARKSGKIINICSLMSELGRDTVGRTRPPKEGLRC